MNKIIRLFKRNQKIIIISAAVLFLIYYFFIRDPELQQLKKPTFDPAASNLTKETKFKIKAAKGAKIHYELIKLHENETAEGVDVGLLSKKFSNPIQLKYGDHIKIKAFAVKDGFKDSKVVTHTYKVQKKLEKPKFHIRTAFDSNNKIIDISGQFGTTIYYTLDGSKPNPETKNTKEYKDKFEVKQDVTIKAIATKTNFFPSDIKTKKIQVKEENTTTKKVKKPEPKENFIINVRTKGEGKADPMSKTVKEGSIINLKATPTENWVFKEWQGDITGSNINKKVRVNKDLNITAVFEKVKMKDETKLGLRLTPIKTIKEGKDKLILFNFKQGIILHKLRENSINENESIWDKIINLDKNIKAIDFINTQHQYVILGNKDKFPYLIKINKSNFQTSITKLDLKNIKTKKIKKLNNKFIVGGTYSTNSSDQHMSISLITKTGKIVWNKLSYYKEDDNMESLADLRVDSKGNIIAIGNIISDVNSDIFIYKLSSKGKVLLKKKVGNFNNDMGNNLIFFDRNYLISGETNNIYPESKKKHKGYNVLLEKRDSKGKFIDRYILGGKDNFYPVDLKTGEYFYILAYNSTKDSTLLVKLGKHFITKNSINLDKIEPFSMNLNQNTIDILAKDKVGRSKLITVNKNIFEVGIKNDWN